MILLLLATLAAAEPRVFVKARAAQPGEMLFVAVEEHDDDVAPAGRFGERPLSFFRTRKRTWAAFAGIDLDVSTGPRRLVLELRDKDGAPSVWDQELLVEPKDYPTQRLKVEQRYVTPPKDDSTRAEDEARKLNDVFGGVTTERYFKGNFASPIPGSTSARFGERRVFNGVPKQPHSGADLRAAAGTPIKAPAGGKVVLVADLFYQGKTVVLDHGYGLYSYYAHLSEALVSEGDTVKKGKELGLVGATGRVTGPHLHWAVKSGGARIDPFSLTALDLAAWLD